MKILIVDTYYSAFLNKIYAETPRLAEQPYQHQWQTLMNQCFGTADYYSENLHKLGYEATEIVANCQLLQWQWAKEHNVTLQYNFRWRTYRGLSIPWLEKNWFYQILLAQIKAYRPDVIHFQDPGGTDPSFLREIRSYVRLITAQIACPIPRGANFSQYDLMLSTLPHYVQLFREQGLNSQILHLAFEHTLLNKLSKKSVPYSVVHVGGYGPVHQERTELLESLITANVPILCWGYGVDYLPKNSPIHNCYQGEAWGLEMYNVRHNSKIVVSKHVSSVADVYAGMMTLYESTGVGSLLVIDYRKNLPDLFEPGKEVVAYHSSQECVELIQYYLAHEQERIEIACSGQQRTLREHTYYHRMQEFIAIVKSHL